MPDSSSELDQIDILTDEFLERRRRGEDATVDEYCEKHPALADEIRRLFPMLEAMEGLRPFLDERAAEESASPVPALERIGGYRILSEIGRGGMGVVYEAVQESLGRNVAIKVLPRRLYENAKSLARFRQEARAAAALHHTNIVPVFEVGEDGEQVFYAMQLIRGQSLDGVIRELRLLRQGESGGAFERAIHGTSGALGSQSSLAATLTQPVNERASKSELRPSSAGTRRKDDSSQTGVERKLAAELTPASDDQSSDASGSRRVRQRFYRSVADLAVQVADALSYSHERGIIHRDIKPANLLLDAQGVVWVTDFGLAKASENEDLTHTGDIVGTLRYMSPERFSGMCDARADVYSLGLTIYELLTLQPAVSGSDRASLIETIVNRSPASLRSIDPAIPRDLETIVSRCIDKDPAGRYSTAQAVAADLRCFLSDQTISARSASMFERAWRWSRRNRGIAASVAASTLLLLALTLGSIIAATKFHQAGIREKRLAGEMSELAQKNIGIAEEKTALAKLSEERAARREEELYYSEMLQAGFALNSPGGIGIAEDSLERWQPGHIGRELRGWEWHYLATLAMAETRVIRVEKRVTMISWSPDGATFTLSAGQAPVRIHDAASGSEKRRIEGIGMPVEWNPQGTVLGGTNRGVIHLYFAETEEHFRLSVPGEFGTVDWSLDGSLLLVRTGDGCFVVDVPRREIRNEILRTGCRVARFLRHGKDAGKRFVVGGDEELSICDISTGEVVDYLETKLRGVAIRILDVAPNEPIVAAAYHDRGVRLWDYETKDSFHSNVPHGKAISALRYSPSGRWFATAARDGSVEIWGHRGRLVRRLFGHTNAVTAVGWSPDERLLLTSGDDNTIRWWGVEPTEQSRITRAHRQPRMVRWSRDGRLLASRGEYSIRVWEAGTVKRLWEIDRLPKGLGFDWSPDTKTFAIGAQLRPRQLSLIDRATRSVKVLGGLSAKPMVCPRFSPDGSRLAVDFAEPRDGSRRHDWRVVVWNLDSSPPAVECQTPAFDGRIDGVRFRPDGRQLAAINVRGTLGVFDAATGRQIAVYDSNVVAEKLGLSPEVTVFELQNGSRDLDWSPDGRYLAWSRWKTIFVLDTKTNEPLNVLKGHTSLILSLAWSPDGERLASGEKARNIRIWSPLKGKATLSLDVEEAVFSLEWSPDSRRLAAALGVDAIRIFDATAGYERER